MSWTCLAPFRGASSGVMTFSLQIYVCNPLSILKFINMYMYMHEMSDGF